MYENIITISYLSLTDSEASIIRGAIRADLDEIKTALMENPDSIKETDERLNLTALHIVAGNGCYDIVDFLCDQPGCDISARDKLGRTPFYMAKAIGRDDIVGRILRDTHRHIERLNEIDDAVEKAGAVNVTPFRRDDPTP